MVKTKIKTKSTFEKIDNVIKHMLSEKCQYVDCCRLYDKKSPTCNEDAGCFYGPGKLAGCAVELSRHGKKAYCYIEPSPKLNTMKKRSNTNWDAVAIGLVGLSLFILGRAIYLILKVYN